MNDGLYLFTVCVYIHIYIYIYTYIYIFGASRVTLVIKNPAPNAGGLRDSDLSPFENHWLSDSGEKTKPMFGRLVAPHWYFILCHSYPSTWDSEHFLMPLSSLKKEKNRLRNCGTCAC